MVHLAGDNEMVDVGDIICEKAQYLLRDRSSFVGDVAMGESFVKFSSFNSWVSYSRVMTTPIGRCTNKV